MTMYVSIVRLRVRVRVRVSAHLLRERHDHVRVHCEAALGRRRVARERAVHGAEDELDALVEAKVLA